MKKPSTQMNTRCILGNLKREKTQLEGEAYSLLSFLQYENANTKKGALTMELPLTLWLESLLQNLPPLLCSQVPILDVFLYYGTNTMLKNGTLSPHSGPIFNIAW